MKKLTLFIFALAVIISSYAANEITVANSNGANATYNTLTAAFAAINAADQSTKNITVSISATPETAEPGTVSITGAGGMWSTLTIYPTGAAVVISATVAGPLIDLNGADNVTINGNQNNGSGSTQNLTLTNTNSSTTAAVSTIRFINDATGNTVKNCLITGSGTLQSAAATAGTGVIFFSTAHASGNGNDNNTITANNITNAGGNRPVNGIYSFGTAAKTNSGLTISNNKIYDTFSATLASRNIYMDDYTSDCSITGNRIYQPTTLAVTVATNNYRCIHIEGNSDAAPNQNFIINNNVIGGSASDNTGTWTKTSTGVNGFGVIYLAYTTGTNKIDGNSIQNFDWSNTGQGNMNGMVFETANISTAVVGGVAGNTISNMALRNTTSGGGFNGFSCQSIGDVEIRNTTITNINTYNAAANLTYIYGIQKANVAGAFTVIGNTISNCTANSASTGNNQVVAGIYNQSTAATQTITGNTISGLTNLSTRTSSSVVGIFCNAPTTGTNEVKNNFINLAQTSVTSTAIVYGIQIVTGVATYSNNIIALSGNTKNVMYGIYDAGTASNTTNLYYNTVHLSGTPSATANSHALWSNAASNTRNFRNNIFVNARTTNGTHYSAYFNYNANTNLTLNNNDYYAPGTGGKLGRYNGADVTAGTVMVTGKDAGSLTTNPAITASTTAASYKGTAILDGDATTGIGTDYDGANRRVAQMGAFFIPTTVSVSGVTPINSGDLTLTVASQIEVAAGAELTLTNNPNISKIILAPTAKLTMGANTITAPNGVVLQSDATGTATLTGDAAVTNATVQQYVTAGRNWYVSPSVTSGTSSMLSRGDSVVAWNEALKKWEKVTSSLTASRGYIQVATSTPSVTGTTGTVNFTGTTNAGDITTPSLTRTGSVATSGFNLVGNPYPSYLRWSGTNSVITDANNSAIGTSFWYRTKNNADAYIFVTHNGTSGYTIPADQTPNTTITGVIPPMQAFWVRVNSASTTMTFTNAMRLHADNSLNKFKAPKNDDRKRLRLQLANGTATDEALIYFDAAADNGFDNYDSPKMMNNSTLMPDIYSKSGSEKVVINGLNAVSDNLELPLGFTLKAAATGLTFKVSELSNFAAGTKVYLLDSDQNTQTELLPETQYTFNTTAATTNNESRFSLLFRAPGAVTGVAATEKRIAQVFVNAANQISIIAPEKSNYAIYNAVGMVVERGVVNSALQTVNCKLQTGVYVVKVGTSNSTRVIIK